MPSRVGSLVFYATPSKVRQGRIEKILSEAAYEIDGAEISASVCFTTYEKCYQYLRKKLGETAADDGHAIELLDATYNAHLEVESILVNGKPVSGNTIPLKGLEKAPKKGVVNATHGDEPPLYPGA